jgi:23S rRNA pseudouridine955/2504/2580 synthase
VSDASKPAVRQVTIGPGQAGQRLDNFLLGELKGAPKSLVYRILRKGEVRVNKGRARPETRLAAGDVVRIPPVRLGEAPARSQVPGWLTELLGGAILHEDRHLLVLDKPAGVAVHAGSGVSAGVIEGLRALRPEEEGLELAHRLDRETSGVLVLAKDRPTLLELHQALRDDRVHKSYLALVKGAWPAKLGEVSAPLAKNSLRGGERVVEVADDGKQAVTRFAVVERFGERATLVQAQPVTGRTHQIRVHAAHAGHPIAGDDKYGDAELDRALKPHGLSRLFLHAARIELPRGGQAPLSLQAPLPPELARVLASLRESVASAPG